jgi:hypothetical protein
MALYQYRRTNRMHFSSRLLRIDSFNVFQALFAHHQKALDAWGANSALNMQRLLFCNKLKTKVHLLFLLHWYITVHGQQNITYDIIHLKCAIDNGKQCNCLHATLHRMNMMSCNIGNYSLFTASDIFAVLGMPYPCRWNQQVVPKRRWITINLRCLTFHDSEFAGSLPAEAVGFFGRKIPQRAFLRKGSKAVCPTLQICGMLKNPKIYRGSCKL